MIRKTITILLPGLVFLLLCVFFSSTYSAQNTESNRDFIFYSNYNNVVTEKNKEINLEIKLTNTGEKMEEILLSIIPDKEAENWENYFMDPWDYFEIRSVKLDTKEPDNLKKFKFHLIVPKEITTGNYKFTLRAITKDKTIEKNLEIIIGVVDRKIGEVSQDITGEIKITTKFPSMENPAGKEFKFLIKVENNTNATQVLDLGIKLPAEGWSVYCTPQWETDRISAIKLNAGVIENLNLTIIPPIYVEKGEYNIVFTLRSGENVQNIDLMAIVTGTYKLNLRTETEQLNINTVAGEEKKFILYLWNEGSTAIDNLIFSSKVPENWEVIFNPEEFSSLPPAGVIKKFEKIEVIVKTPQRTLTGDYMINLTASGMQDQKTMDIRTTVKTSTKWGWLGILIILFIFFILIGIFVKLKRR